jgi:hypothetical protein
MTHPASMMPCAKMAPIFAIVEWCFSVAIAAILVRNSAAFGDRASDSCCNTMAIANNAPCSPSTCVMHKIATKTQSNYVHDFVMMSHSRHARKGEHEKEKE